LNGIGAKAASNARKHKVTFDEAATVFGDPLALSVYDEESSEEKRWITLGRTESGHLLMVVHTYREMSQTEARVRIISARTPTKREQQTYEAGR
jgi:uncharacterized DUF497 family protein